MTDAQTEIVATQEFSQETLGQHLALIAQLRKHGKIEYKKTKEKKMSGRLIVVQPPINALELKDGDLAIIELCEGCSPCEKMAVQKVEDRLLVLGAPWSEAIDLKDPDVHCYVRKLESSDILQVEIE